MPYIIRDTHTELWVAFKARASAEGRSLRWLLEALIRQYVDRGLDTPAAAPRRKTER